MPKFGVLVVLHFLLASASWALEGKVVKVQDGDTLTILDANNAQHKIRLAQIDAPEIGQSWGQNSKQALNALVIKKIVKVVVVDTDRYGRTVGTVLLGDLDICREQVANGNAWVYRQYMTDESLLAEEEQSKSEGEGLWSEPDPTPPWEWRSQHR